MKTRTLGTTALTAIILIIATATKARAQNIIYEKEDSIFIEEIIKRYPSKKFNTTGERMISLANEFLGKEYVSGTLDEHDNEPLFISCSRLDCTTFVETVLAIALCDNDDHFPTYCKNLEKIRYRNGIRHDYASRLHYTSWWIADSAKHNIIKEVESPFHTAEQSLDLNFMSCNTEKYRHLKENHETREKIIEFEKAFHNIQIKYIPKAAIPQIQDNREIKDGDIIAIVTDIEGLDISHLGFAFWQDGTLYMIHASSREGKVIRDAEPLYNYLASRKKHIGIRVFRAL
ncbi:MAG: DUF1460 domain-containing protein [Bacteroidaceae bacterium]|nr:DUF1460 domain-containing protein [Bacteroidaceae bacterium]